MSIPAEMRAVAIPKHGDLDVIQDFKVATPAPTPGHVLVKVLWAGVNFRDTYVRTGLYPAKAFPFVLGEEAAAVVVRLPSDEQTLSSDEFKNMQLQIGVRVVVMSSYAFAEYMSVPWSSVHIIPEFIPTKLAVASAVQGLTALTFMTDSYNVQKDDWVLVHTAAGGVGLIFCQIGRLRGAHVIGTTSSKEKAAIAKANGAEHVIIYTEEDTVQRVLDITGGKGVQVIYDGVGKDTWESDFKMIARKGTLVSVGNASGAVPPFPPLKLIEKNVKLLRPTRANYLVTPEEKAFYFKPFWKMIQSGDIKVQIHKEYPFSAEGVKDSQADIVGRGTVGKLLIRVSDDE